MARITDVPDYFRLKYSAAEIAEHLQTMGSQITTWAFESRARTGQDVIAVPVLRGAVYFFADLMRTLKCSIEMAPIRTKSYIPTDAQKMRPEVAVELGDLNVKGRCVLLVDDICDSGRTMRVLSEHLTGLGATDVRSAVLIRRVLPDPPYQPNWIAFDYSGPEWFVGYGMEDDNRWTNLPDVYTIPPAI